VGCVFGVRARTKLASSERERLVRRRGKSALREAFEDLADTGLGFVWRHRKRHNRVGD